MSDNHENLKETLHEAHKERVQEREELKKGARETRKEIKEMRKKKLSFKELLKVTFSLSEDNASPEEVRDRILSGGKVTGQNAFMLMLAILIASVGLNTNSTAIIIGAMLISPLMGSILALAYGTVVRDGAIIRRYGMGLITQIVISLLTSTVYFLLSPVKGPTSELLARTTPTFFDVIVAVCGGLAGIIANTRKDKSGTIIPGVAIATAIMPPLCTCGYSIANGKWNMFIGALYLFILNAYFIYSSAEIILTALRLPEAMGLPERKRRAYILRRVRNTIFV
ncbi:MAG: DUF389 domain-containing protein, partial [Lachnospiraceae bacterium]|nr:DUF389 domain-containing protein [Lachnospiraceae bacterium]